MTIRSMSTTEPSTATSRDSARSSATSTATSTRSRPSMVSATATTKPEAGWRAFARSRITRIIFIWNFVGLAVLIVGVLLLSEMRAGLTDAEYKNLRVQGELVTNLLIETGTVQGDPDPYISGDAVRDVMQRL